MTGQDTGTKEAEGELEEYVMLSYRYLRLAIVVLLAGLGAALIGQRWSAGCIEGSISAYYYTPVHALFIGALVAMGAAMVALKGRTIVEDAMFNIAGMLAPVVALVPTTRQDALCKPGTPLNLDRNELIPNSLFALGAACIVILAVTALVAQYHKTLSANAKSFWEVAKTGMVPIVVIVVLAAAAKFLLDKPWYTVVHFGAAVGLFTAIYLAIGSLLNERLHDFLHRVLTWERPTAEYHKLDEKYHARYKGVLILTVVCASVVAVAAIVGLGRTWVFWLEVVGIVSFTFFWIIQTAELWDRLPKPPSSE